MSVWLNIKDLAANWYTMKDIYKLKIKFMKAKLIQIFLIIEYIIKVLIVSLIKNVRLFFYRNG